MLASGKSMLAALLLFAACYVQSAPAPSGPPPGGPAPAPGTPAPPPGTPAPAPTAGPKLGEPCNADGVCGEGACVTYYGIAGPRGPAFKSCEVRCDPTTACPSGKQCVTVADGPGQVCR